MSFHEESVLWSKINKFYFQQKHEFTQSCFLRILCITFSYLQGSFCWPELFKSHYFSLLLKGELLCFVTSFLVFSFFCSRMAQVHFRWDSHVQQVVKTASTIAALSTSLGLYCSSISVVYSSLCDCISDFLDAWEEHTDFRRKKNLFLPGPSKQLVFIIFHCVILKTTWFLQIIVCS